MSPALREAIESNIDSIIEDPKGVAYGLKKAEIEPTESALTAFAFGFILALAVRFKRFIEKEELAPEETKKLLKIMRRRRMDIIDAIRGYLE